jgi:iron complex outermembrane receptor protein
MASQIHTHQFGDVHERDRHTTVFGETAVRGVAGRHTWVAGAAVDYDAFRPRDLPQFAYTFTIPGLFVQDDVDLASWATASASARLDVHSEYGAFVSPRVSVLLRPGGWSARFSAGSGFVGPTPLTEETEAAGLTRLQIPRALDAETGRSLSLDVTRRHGPWEATASVFQTVVRRPIRVERTNAYAMANLAEPTRTLGAEALLALRHGPFSVTASYTYIRSREIIGDVETDVPLTPRHSAGLVGMWEAEDAGRIGVEWYYTGVQSLEANPYRDASEPYMIVGLLAERRFGRVRAFVNGENLTGVRQTRWDSLIRPAQGPDGRWTVDGWAPLEGRTINGGVRIGF